MIWLEPYAIAASLWPMGLKLFSMIGKRIRVRGIEPRAAATLTSDDERRQC